MLGKTENTRLLELVQHPKEKKIKEIKKNPKHSLGSGEPVEKCYFSPLI